MGVAECERGEGESRLDNRYGPAKQRWVSQKYFWMFLCIFFTFHIFLLYSCSLRVENRYGLAKERGVSKNTFVFCIIPATQFWGWPYLLMRYQPTHLLSPISMVCVSSRSWNSARQMVFLNILIKSWERENPHSGWNKILNNYGVAEESKVAKSFKSFTFSARCIIARTDIRRPKS